MQTTSENCILDSWIARRVSDIEIDGKALSTAGCAPKEGDPGWLSAQVPETSLSLLVRNGLLPDPYKDFNIQDIPDIYHFGSAFYTFWWCTKFATPKSKSKFKRHCIPGRIRNFLKTFHLLRDDSTMQYHLHFAGVNYSLQVYINGEILDIGQDRGMYLRRSICVSHHLQPEGEMNYLAVKVLPPDHVGCVDLGGQGGDHEIAKDVTAQYVEGWDWIQPVPDRNTGFWGNVSLEGSGPLLLSDPHVQVMFKNNDLNRADVSLKVFCRNCTNDKFNIRIKGCAMLNNRDALEGDIMWDKLLSMKSQEYCEIDLGIQSIDEPTLWYPIGYGGQTLYKARISVQVGDEVSHQISTTFGFRQLDSFIDSRTQGRTFVVNNIPIYIRGGNYILPDAFLCADNKRCWQEVKYHANMGMNMIRLWGGASVPYSAFYEACDHFGVLVWSEFWITGDCDGRGATPASPNSDPNWPLDHSLFLDSASDVVRLLRNHPSIVIWCGGNEQRPCKELDDGLRVIFGQTKFDTENNFNLKELDNSRPYVSGSLWDGFGQGHGNWSDGPYGIVDERKFFSPDFYKYAFNPEIGSVGVPCAESIRSTFSPQNQAPPQLIETDYNTIEERVSEAWNLHNYISYTTAEGVNKILVYGEPSNLDEFCLQAQIVNYVQYKAILEGWGSFMWAKYTGMLIWKTANPWTGLRGQLYDNFLHPCGGLFGVQSVCEATHIQMNLLDQTLEVVNTSVHQYRSAVVNVQIAGLDDSFLSENIDNIDISSNSVTKIPYKISKPDSKVNFVKLTLQGVKMKSRNVYWNSADPNDYSALKAWGSKKLELQSSIQSSFCGNNVSCNIEIKNVNNAVAFWVVLKVCTSMSPLTCDDYVRPVYYSQNCITLFPGESSVINMEFESQEIQNTHVLVDGWNVKKMLIPVQPTNVLLEC